MKKWNYPKKAIFGTLLVLVLVLLAIFAYLPIKRRFEKPAYIDFDSSSSH